MNKRIDLETTESQHKGFKGLFETLLRKFKNGMHIVTMIPVYLFGAVVIGTCLVPGVSVYRMIYAWAESQPTWIQNMSYGFGLASGFFLYGFTLIFLCPLLNFVIRGYLKPWRGPYHSAEAFKWFIHNAFTYIPRFTFLEFITPSPLAVLFYRMMGMKMGTGTVINTTWISDPSMIELGDKVTLGGSVTMVGHYGQGGLLIIAPVKIGNNCTIGLKATVMGGVTIGNDVKVLPHSVVLPKTVIPDGETWGGVPARKIEIASSTEVKPSKAS